MRELGRFGGIEGIDTKRDELAAFFLREVRRTAVIWNYI